MYRRMKMICPAPGCGVEFTAPYHPDRKPQCCSLSCGQKMSWIRGRKAQRKQYAHDLPFDPLEAKLRDTPNQTYENEKGGAYQFVSQVRPTDRTLGLLLAPNGSEESGMRKIQRWRRDGMTVYDADEAAVRIGCHPMEIWGDQWLDARLHTEAGAEAAA